MSTFLLLPLSTKCSCWLWNISAWLYTIRLEGGLLICVFIFWLPNKHVVSWLTHCKYSTNVCWMCWFLYPSKHQNSPSKGAILSPVFFKKKIYLFIFGCVGSSLLQAFSICGERGLLFLVLYGLTILVALTGSWA